MIAKRVAYIVSGLVIASSGAYLFVYLYRWEWNRALIAGVIFVAAEIALAAMMILEKIKKLEDKLDNRTAFSENLEALQETAPPPRARFKWLAGGDGDLHVFIPVLMGAGMVFSALAWVVERFARATAKPALEHGLAIRLQPLALPEGGFLSPITVPRPAPKINRIRFKYAFFVLVSIAVVSTAIDLLGDLTQNRPELDVIQADRGAITLDITREGWARSDVAAAKSLWRACMATVSPEFHANGFMDAGNGQVTMLISPAPGMSAERRLRGCLQDATLDNVSARVLSFRAAP